MNAICFDNAPVTWPLRHVHEYSHGRPSEKWTVEACADSSFDLQSRPAEVVGLKRHKDFKTK